MASKYYEKLKDPRWQKKRLEIMQRDGFKCRECGDATSQLTVHHTYYVSGRLPWMYPNWSLFTLCQNCHSKAHEAALERVDLEGLRVGIQQAKTNEH